MYLADVPFGTIIFYDGTSNFFMKVKGYQGISGVVNLSTGIFYTGHELEARYNVDFNHFYYVSTSLEDFMCKGD